eukprot:c16784_g1_i1 orf=92-274(+)
MGIMTNKRTFYNKKVVDKSIKIGKINTISTGYNLGQKYHNGKFAYGVNLDESRNMPRFTL